MAEIIWTEPALQSLDEIADYISLDNPSAARALVRNNFQSIELLEQQPLAGKTIPEIEISIFREIVIVPCRVFYRIENRFIYIVHVQRQEQRFRNPFF